MFSKYQGKPALSPVVACGGGGGVGKSFSGSGPRQFLHVLRASLSGTGLTQEGQVWTGRAERGQNSVCGTL